jgi:hypothetical protein
MDHHYNWNDATFKNRCGESLNLAVNAVADVLHSFYNEVIPESWIILPLLMVATIFAVAVRKKISRQAPQKG